MAQFMFFHHSVNFVILCDSLLYLNYDVEILHTDQAFVCNLELHQNYGRDFGRVRLVLAP